MNPFVLLGVGVGLLLFVDSAKRRTTHPRQRHRRNIQAYTDAEGIVHPIRDSRGYDPDVDEIAHEERERAEREERYRGVERASASIQRPPWARGMSQERIESIARSAGRSPYEEHWWQGARLYPGTGEYRALVLEAGAPRKRREVESHRRGHEPRTREERIKARTEAHRVAQRAGEDLPW